MDKKIIVIDDERDFLDSVKRGLNISGIKKVRLEPDPAEAASAFERGEAFDIAIIDINMPEMNGIKLLEVIKKNSPTTECIMVSAIDEAKTVKSCLDKGARDYLVKPVSKDDLVSSINRALEHKRVIRIK